MVYDRNPKFGEDQSFSEKARQVTDLLWSTTRGDLGSFPQSYLENLRYEFSDGKVSMLELIDRVNLEPDATYEDYCEVVDALLCVDPEKWPDPSSVLEVPAGKLTYEIEQDFDFAEEILEEDEVIEEEPSAPKPDPISEKMELFMKKIISSVYLDGVTNVTDMDGNPPNSANNYLLSEDGKQFRGVFYDAPGNSKPKQFPFVISENESGKWIIKY